MFLVKNSNDPAVAIHALQYVQPNPKMDYCLKSMVTDFRRGLTRHLVALTSDTTYAFERQSERAPLASITLRNLPLEMEQASRQSNLMKKQREIIEQQHVLMAQHQKKAQKLQEEFMKQQLQHSLNQQQKQQLDMAMSWRELLKLEDAVLRRRLTDANPLVRMLAVQMAGRRWLPVEKEAIALLADPNPPIRQAAWQTLVRLARGADFGPEPTATGPQIAMSRQHWNHWLSLQQDVPEERQPESGKK